LKNQPSISLQGLDEKGHLSEGLDSFGEVKLGAGKKTYLLIGQKLSKELIFKESL